MPHHQNNIPNREFYTPPQYGYYQNYQYNPHGWQNQAPPRVPNAPRAGQQSANLDLSIIDLEPQPLSFTSDIRRSTSIALALEKKKISFSGKPGQDPVRFLRQHKECQNTLEITEDEILKKMT